MSSPSFREALPRGLFVLAVAVLLAIGALSHRSISSQIEASAWVASSHERIARINALQAEIALATSARRGYAMTSDPRWEARFRSAVNETRAALGELRAVTHHSPEHGQRVQRISSIVDRAVAHLEAAIEYDRTMPRDSRREAETVRAGTDVIDELGSALREMRVAERALFASRQQDSIAAARWSRTVILSGTVSSALLLGAFALLLARQARHRRVVEERFERLLESAPDAMFLLSPHGSILLANGQAEKLTGQARGALLGRPLAEFLVDSSGAAPDSPRAVLERLQALAPGESVELGFLGRGVGAVPVEISASPAQLPDRTLLAAVRDITRRKQLEAERQKIFDVSRDLLCEAGTDGTFKRLNPAWERVLGWSLQELMARPYFDFIHPEDRERTVEEAKALGDGRHTLSFENRYRCKDGSYRWLAWVAAGVLPGDTVIYASARDVTERRRADEAIRALNEELGHKHAEALAANQELESFSYSVSHDLRAPLRAIDGFSRIVLEDYRDKLDDEGRRLLKVVRDNTARMGRLIDDLLSFSRLGRKAMQVGTIDMTALARSVYAELAPTADGRPIVCEIGELPKARGDPGMIRQVWVNLLSNAIKYTRGREPATIRVEGRVAGDTTQYTVRDNGAGFDMRYADKLFGVFQRMHSAAEFEGTGVGLALVQRVVHRHLGRVWAEGKVGEGAAFSFALPGGDTSDG